jgi:hypothetical protein
MSSNFQDRHQLIYSVLFLCPDNWHSNLRGPFFDVATPSTRSESKLRVLIRFPEQSDGDSG